MNTLHPYFSRHRYRVFGGLPNCGFARNGLIALLMLLAAPAIGRAQDCLPSAAAVRAQSPDAWPRWTLRAPGHAGIKCWYAVGRSAVLEHRKRGTGMPDDEVQAPVSQGHGMACADLQAEILANNRRVAELAAQNGWDMAQAGETMSGLYVWPVVIATDFAREENTEATRLQARQQKLATLVAGQCERPELPSASVEHPTQ